MAKGPRFRGKRAPGTPAARFSPYQVGLIVVLLVAYGIFYGFGQGPLGSVPTWVRIVVVVLGLVAVVWIYGARKDPEEPGPR
jgi:hypothetical protein